jgi:multidrug resistance efflux pump
MRKWIAVFAVVALALAAGGAVAWRLRHRAPEAPVRAGGAAALPADTGIVTLTGTVRAQHVVTFGPAGKGNIEAFMADVGDEVGEGEAVARVGAMGLEADRENASTDVRKAQDRVTQAESAVKDARLEESRAAADLEKARAVLERSTDFYLKEKVRIEAGAIPRLEFEKAEADHAIAQQTVDVMDKAWRAASDNILAVQQVEDREKAALDQAVQKLQDLQAQLDGTEVRSPVEGWVVARQGQIGQPADSAGEQMFQVATDLAALEVALDPKPEVLKRIFSGIPTMVLIPEVTDAAIEGDVKTNANNEVVVEFVSAMPAIRPGMKADVRLKLN